LSAFKHLKFKKKKDNKTAIMLKIKTLTLVIRRTVSEIREGIFLNRSLMKIII
jgi:hypothetical protein